MHDHQNVQLLRLRPEWVEVFAVKIFAHDVGSDGHAGHFEIVDGILQHFRCARRILQRHRGNADEAVGMALN